MDEQEEEQGILVTKTAHRCKHRCVWIKRPRCVCIRADHRVLGQDSDSVNDVARTKR